MSGNSNTTDHIGLQLSAYLSKPSSHAILLTGAWGTGKTFYIKNKFFPSISGQPFKPIIVSLFGLSSIDEIKEKIFLELYSWTGNKYLKISGTVIKAALKSIDITKLVGEGLLSGAIDQFSDVKKELSAQKFDFLNLEKLLICFDDLERASPELLSGSQVLGFINSLVEDRNVKVIIIANEDKIIVPQYREIKEKTISQTVHFEQDFESVFTDLLAGSGVSASCKAYLEAKRSDIEKLLTGNDGDSSSVNFRVLGYFFSCYGEVFDYIDCALNLPDLAAEKNNILQALLRFSIMTCCEFKKGRISFREKKGLEQAASLRMLQYVAQKIGKEKEPDYAQLTLEQYFPEEGYYFYETLFNYITGGTAFSGPELLQEIYKQYNVVQDHISPAYKVYQALHYPACLKLGDRQYVEHTRALRKFALAGDFEIWHYDTIFYQICRFGNVLNINPEKLEKQLIRVVRSKLPEHEYHGTRASYYRELEEDEFKKGMQGVREAILWVNEETRIRGEQAIIRRIEKGLREDFGELYQWYLQSLNSPERVSLAGVSPRLFFSAWLSAGNMQKNQMNELLRINYDPRQGNYASGDQEFLWGLEQLLRRRLDRDKNKGLGYQLLQECHKIALEELMKRVPFSILS